MAILRQLYSLFSHRIGSEYVSKGRQEVCHLVRSRFDRHQSSGRQACQESTQVCDFAMVGAAESVHLHAQLVTAIQTCPHNIGTPGKSLRSFVSFVPMNSHLCLCMCNTPHSKTNSGQPTRRSSSLVVLTDPTKSVVPSISFSSAKWVAKSALLVPLLDGSHC